MKTKLPQPSGDEPSPPLRRGGDSLSPQAPLPSGWQRARLNEIAELNPRRPAITRSDDTPTTFVPMPAVAEGGAGIANRQLRPFREIRKGYTYFAEGDVLFAKITPCMQNGKHSIARDLTDGIGFGSTEFHVLRPSPRVTAEWLHFFLCQPSVLQEAAAHLSGAVGQQRVPEDYLSSLEIPLPPLSVQRRIAARLRGQLAEVAQARTAIEAQADGFAKLIHALVRESLRSKGAVEHRLAECLSEITEGIGEAWADYPVLGATRAGLAMAKEPVGKIPARYKPVRPGTIFYNPMRILLGSIAMVDDHDPDGVTSPDYVVMRCIEDRLHPRWFYHWFRSSYGAAFIKSMTRGAVRERLMFRRLAPASVRLPAWRTQLAVADRLRQVKQVQGTLAARLTALDRLPAALLREAFGGRI